MSNHNIDPASQIGVDASGLDMEMRKELENERKSSVLGKLGTSGYMKVIPERINRRQRTLEQGEES